MARRTFAYVTALLAGGLLTVGTLEARQSPQNDRPVFRARVNLVTLPVSVLDSDDLPVEGLGAADFAVLEDDVERDVALLLTPEETPLDIALLMDVSESMHSSAGVARTSALQFLNQLAADDCVLLLRFTAIPGPGIWGSPNDQGIRAAITETPMEGGTAVRDAAAEGFQRLRHDTDRCGPMTGSGGRQGASPRRRPALVVVTDGEDRSSVLTFDNLLGIARQADVPFLPVGFGAISSRAWYLRGRSGSMNRSMLEGLARVTGGQFIEAGRGAERLSAAYEKVIHWLRSYYVVGYYPPSQDDARLASEIPSWHEVEVQIRRPGYRVQSREGYYRSPIDVAAAGRHINEGLERLSQGEAAEALAELNLALESDPYSWEAHYHTGKTLTLTKQTQAAQQELLSAAGLSPGRGQVHKLAGLVSLALDDYGTAWDQAIRAQQAGIDTAAEIMLLRQKSTAPANIEERLRAPRVYVDHYRGFDLVEQAAVRMATRALARELSKESGIGLTDREAQADYRIFIKLTKLEEKSPRKLEADLELREPVDNAAIQASEALGGNRKFGKRVHRQRITLSDIEDKDRVAAELAPHIAELRSRMAEQR